MLFNAVVGFVVIFSFLNRAHGGNIITASSNITVNNGSTLTLAWDVIPSSGEPIDDFRVSVKLHNSTMRIVTGKSPQITRIGYSLFGTDRISTEFNDPKFYLILKDVRYNESLTYQLFVLFGEGLNIKGEISHIQVTVTGSPNLCGEIRKSNYTVQENEVFTFWQVICGHPKPHVQWKIGVDRFGNSITSALIDEETRRYNYTFEKPLTRANCGELIVLNATNNVKSLTWKTTVYVKFIPLQVSIEKSFKQNMSCVHVTWQGEVTGKCALNYYLQFDGQGDVYNTFDEFLTQCNLPNASNVTVWASYRGINGSKTTKNISEFAPPTTTTKRTVITSKNTSTTTPEKNRTTPSGTVITSPDKGNNIGLIVGIVGGILFVIIVIIIIVCVLKHKKKNGTGNHSGYAMRVTGEENNYVTDPTYSNRRQPANPDDPEQAIYSELGPGGGRTGPRPAPEQSDYAEMKVDAMGYPIDGAKASEPPTYAPVIKPREGAKRRTPSPPRSNVDGARSAASTEPPAYAPIIKNRSSSRGRSPPPDEDDHEGVIV
uniref:Allorecognition 1 n=1 Tax=Hydractinia symbiolongicarpus TaxID=13093 RepID=D9ZHU0_HYDSY|nr:allorecognition 1 [Hydractinia symbiolongicarpus]